MRIQSERDPDSDKVVLDELTNLVMRLSWELNKLDPGNTLSNQAVGFMRDNELLSISVIRTSDKTEKD